VARRIISPSGARFAVDSGVNYRRRRLILDDIMLPPVKILGFGGGILTR
jgi:hypothetical protein